MYYIDPVTGYQVMTSLALLKRGRCCGSGCRHCPYSHMNVSSCRRQFIHPFYIRNNKERKQLPTKTKFDVLFYSGGKDSHLALLELLSQQDRSSMHVVLFTTYDPDLGKHGLQNVDLDHILDTARKMQLDIVAVPIPKHASYQEAVEKGLALIEGKGKIDKLVFGDLHLKRIREWRENTFSNYECYFPLWMKPYDALMRRLEMQSNLSVKVSAVDELHKDKITIGEVFDQAFIRNLPTQIDAFGENGEFHTQCFVGN